MYKLIAADMDGTLLNDDCEINPAVYKAVDKARAAGLLFTVSTGRPIQGITKYLDILDGDVPVISCNGAILVRAVSGETLFRAEMGRSEAMEIIERGRREGAVVAAWSGGKLYSTEVGSAYSDFYKTLSNMDTLSVSELPDADVTKLVWILPSEKVLELQKSYIPPKGVQSRCSGDMFLEFFSVDAGKDKALAILAESLGVTLEETVAIGDNYNDMDMLKAAGLGVAMGNAPDEVKKAADLVTDTNENDGVAKVIDNILLSR